MTQYKCKTNWLVQTSRKNELDEYIYVLCEYAQRFDPHDVKLMKKIFPEFKNRDTMKAGKPIKKVVETPIRANQCPACGGDNAF